MPKSSEIIKEIKADADELQKKLTLLLEAEISKDYTNGQMLIVFRANFSLKGWRGWELGELEKAFIAKNKK